MKRIVILIALILLAIFLYRQFGLLFIPIVLPLGFFTFGKNRKHTT
jgi:hypothetical protein